MRRSKPGWLASSAANPQWDAIESLRASRY